MGLITAGDAERIAKLPIWARHLFEQLDDELTHTQEALAAYKGDAPPTNTTAFPKDIPASLGDDVLVRFRFGGSYADVRILNNELSVRSDMDTQFTVAPRSSNILRIRAERKTRSALPGS